MKPIKLFSMFSGYGGAEFALNELGIEYEVVGYSEIDKYAIQCYEQNHFDTSDLSEESKKMCYDNFDLVDKSRCPKNYGDCTKIIAEELPDFDLLTGGFPCQAFSQAGKMQGELDPRGTLFWDIVRIVQAKQPKYFVLENVKGLTTKKFTDTFNKIIESLHNAGYNIQWKVLNTKDYGIPQNRERVIFVGIRADIKQEFSWPEKQELKILIKDILEKEVEEKYYLSEKAIQKIFIRHNGKLENINSFSKTITSGDNYKIGLHANCILDVSHIRQENKPREYPEVAPSLNTAGGGGHTPLVLDLYNKTAKDKVCPTLTDPNHNTLRVAEVSGCALRTHPRGSGLTEEEKKNRSKKLEIRKDEVSNALTCVQEDSLITDGIKVRKLTPKECFRLQGFLRDQINLEGLSDTQKYKLAGNGWSINVFAEVFKKLIIL